MDFHPYNDHTKSMLKQDPLLLPKPLTPTINTDLLLSFHPSMEDVPL
jgi:hypothetical protein